MVNGTMRGPKSELGFRLNMMYEIICLRVSLLSILDRKGKRLIGLYKEVVSKSLSGFANNTIF
jgi:hypothetical protein